MPKPSEMTDTDLRSEIELIEENVAETGRRSSYAHRNLPVLRILRAEAKRRGL